MVPILAKLELRGPGQINGLIFSADCVVVTVLVEQMHCAHETSVGPAPSPCGYMFCHENGLGNRGPLPNTHLLDAGLD